MTASARKYTKDRERFRRQQEGYSIPVDDDPESNPATTPICPEAENAFIVMALQHGQNARLYDWVKPEWLHDEDWRTLWETAHVLIEQKLEANIETVHSTLIPRIGETRATEIYFRWLGAMNDLVVNDGLLTIAKLIKQTYVRREAFVRSGRIAYEARYGDVEKLLRELTELQSLVANIDIEVSEISLGDAFAVLQTETEMKMDGKIMCKTGISNLDKKVHLVPNTLIVLSAPTSGGKSTAAKSAVVNFILQEDRLFQEDENYEWRTVEYYNFEMSAAEQALRIAAQLVNLDLEDFMTGFMRQKRDENGGIIEEADAIEYLRQIGLAHPIIQRLSRYIYFHDKPMSADDIAADVERISRLRRIGEIVIDQTEQVIREERNPVAEYTHMYQVLKSIAKTHGCIVWALHQMTKEIDHRPGRLPQPSDLLWANAIGQSADYILFIDWPYYWYGRGDDQVVGDPLWFQQGIFFVIAKDRRGPNKDKWAYARFIRERSMMTSWSHEEMGDPRDLFVERKARAEAAAKDKVGGVRNGVLD